MIRKNAAGTMALSLRFLPLLLLLAPSAEAAFTRHSELTFAGAFSDERVFGPPKDKEIPEKLPEQGFTGEHVTPDDLNTKTGDWRTEYGPKSAAGREAAKEATGKIEDKENKDVR